MTPDQAVVIRDHFVALFKQEHATTRRVIAAAPSTHAAYAPTERCMAAGKLMRHIAESEVFFLRGIAAGEFKRDGMIAEGVEDPAGILAWYDENQPAALAAVAATSGEDMIKSITFFKWTLPAHQFLPFGLLHGIHHRGQLSSYLRPMGSKVPVIYGRSADDDGSGAA